MVRHSSEAAALLRTSLYYRFRYPNKNVAFNAKLNSPVRISSNSSHSQVRSLICERIWKPGFPADVYEPPEYLPSCLGMLLICSQELQPPFPANRVPSNSGNGRDYLWRGCVNLRLDYSLEYAFARGIGYRNNQM